MSAEVWDHSVSGGHRWDLVGGTDGRWRCYRCKRMALGSDIRGGREPHCAAPVTLAERVVLAFEDAPRGFDEYPAAVLEDRRVLADRYSRLKVHMGYREAARQAQSAWLETLLDDRRPVAPCEIGACRTLHSGVNDSVGRNPDGVAFCEFCRGKRAPSREEPRT